LTYTDHDEEAAKSDKLPFENVGAPDFQDTINESCTFLLTKSLQLKSLVLMLKSKCWQIGLDFNALPEAIIEGVDGKLGVLLSKQELEDAVQRS